MSAKPSDSSDSRFSVNRLLNAAQPALSDELAGMFQDYRESIEAETTERLRKALLDEENNRWRALAEYQQKIGEATSQSQIVRLFLGTAVRFAESAAVYLNKNDGLTLWGLEGEPGIFPETVDEETIDPDWFFSLVVVRGRTVAGVGAAGPSDVESLAIMADALERAIENFGLRLRFLVDGNTDASALTPVVKAMPEPPAPAEAGPRQLARSIVSGIARGHETEILDGRVHSDLYRRFRKGIDEGRDAYSRQLSSPPDRDYFHEEVVQILAGNTASRLGADYPGPVDNT